ncbi:hypothetical protein V5O48_013519 [Marasmius crinis-equi]|uniref:Uncharacterized protein n=1 Tax=Marasmius crinis-equi TaxID=585013 RepID=A0ABR3F081_9AGAR
MLLLLTNQLQIQMDCYYDETLWMDTLRGVFCRGPKGPYWVGVGALGFEDLPSDAELVKEDTLLRYLISRNQDRVVVNGLSLEWNGGTSQLEVNQPTVISTLTDTILAVGSGVWNEEEESCLGEREELVNGATRFSLLHNGRRLELESDWEESWRGWLAQASNIFHAHGISLEGDMREYKLVLPELLTGTLSNSEAQQRRRKESPPIYLFIPPLSASTFWSFDPDGQNPITTDLCHHLGLPISLELRCGTYCWRTETYKALQTYQIARGFDPNTNEFARHNRYCIYKIVEQPFSSRFEEIESSEPTKTSLHPEDISLGALSGDVQLKGETPLIYSTTKATAHGLVLKKGARYSPDCPDHNQPSTPHSDFTDFVWVDTTEIDCTLPRDLISVSPTRDSEIVPAEAGTKDAIPPKLNAWSRFLPAFS